MSQKPSKVYEDTNPFAKRDEEFLAIIQSLFMITWAC